ncbi:MAG TPA: LysR family transcriptional regulator [Gammaproteobacteria bacterium]|nr:LysR family transcriptional regulator [Gammaproteobacteria bacterium]
MNNVPWQLINTFLQVSQQGSLSAAAKKLDVSQPTVSRDIQALEKITQLHLFKRSTQGLELTQAGQALVESALKMQENALAFDRQAAGMSTKLEGTIRISANEIVGVYLLPQAIAQFTRQHPDIQIEIVISNDASNLNKREADIALRMFRPSQPDLIAKRLADMPLGFFAHEDYISQYGEPKDMAQFKQHRLIGFDQRLDFIEGAGQFGYKFFSQDFYIRTDNLLVQTQLARSGGGIIATHVGLAKRWRELKQIMQWVPLPPLEFWLVCHADVQYSARIRALKSFLTQWFEEDVYRGASD